MRLQAAADGQRPPAHSAVRAANQPLQREDLHVHVVLVRARRRRHGRQLHTLVVDYRTALQPDTLRPQTPQGIAATLTTTLRCSVRSKQK